MKESLTSNQDSLRDEITALIRGGDSFASRVARLAQAEIIRLRNALNAVRQEEHELQGVTYHLANDALSADPSAPETKAPSKFDQLRARIEEMRSALYTYSAHGYGESIGGPILDGVMDAIDELEKSHEETSKNPLPAETRAATSRGARSTEDAGRPEPSGKAPADECFNPQCVKAHDDVVELLRTAVTLHKRNCDCEACYWLGRSSENGKGDGK